MENIVLDNIILKMFQSWQKWDDHDQEKRNNYESITSPKLDDGAIEIEASSYGGVTQKQLGTQVDPTAKSSRDLIDQYRGLMVNYEVDNAVQEIVSSGVVYERDHDSVSISLDQTKFPTSLKEKIIDEFNIVLNSLDFQRKGSDHFRRWYIDSRIFFHKIIDVNNLKKGIVEMRRLDPRNVTYVREVQTRMEHGVKVVTGYENYFRYDTSNESYTCGGITYAPGTVIKIPSNAMTYAHSGLTGCDGKGIIGYLHRAVKPANQLKMLEDAMVIYRIVRAPDRRVIYIDTGIMPAKLATQHMQNVMNSMKNRINYDSSTGKITNQQNTMTLTDDIWLQRREGKAITEVETLPGMQGMSDIDDILYFRKALYLALRVPLSRIPDAQQQAMFDNGTTISREELNFDEFIVTLQHKFEEIFLNPLRTNLILKKIITEDEWNDEINNIKIVFHKNSYFSELKDIELEQRRLDILQAAEGAGVIGKYKSHRTAMRQYLQMSDEDIENEQKLIKEEQSNKILNPPIDEEGM